MWNGKEGGEKSSDDALAKPKCNRVRQKIDKFLFETCRFFIQAERLGM